MGKKMTERMHNTISATVYKLHSTLFLQFSLSHVQLICLNSPKEELRIMLAASGISLDRVYYLSIRIYVPRSLHLTVFPLLSPQQILNH